MKKNAIFLIIATLLVIVGAYYFSSEAEAPENSEEVQYEELEATYQCDEEVLDAVFYNSDQESYVEITLPSEETITAYNVISASGAKYQTEDETYVFWTQGEEAFLEKDGEIVYEGCVTTDFEEEIENVEEGEEAEIDQDLVGKWQWVKTIYNNDEEVVPEGDDFVLTLNEDGTMSSTTDCNNLSGQFETTEENQINFSKVAMTKMYCEGSLEDEYLRVINDSSSYLFEENSLVITIKYDSGSAIFKPVE
jgi:membrane-bound inhibitor of C-type lysozyme/heat shock protein HslJ